jgi:hypothetical protein
MIFDRIFGRDIFDWKTVPTVHADELAAWIGATDAKERDFPLAVALQTHDELERELMDAGRMDNARLHEIRGGLKALARFAQIYRAALKTAAAQEARDA